MEDARRSSDRRSATGGVGEIVVESRAGVAVVSVAGPLTPAIASDLCRTMGQIDGPIVVDCVRVRSADPRAIGTLGRASVTRGEVILRRVRPSLRESLQVMNLAHLVAYAERETGRAR